MEMFIVMQWQANNISNSRLFYGASNIFNISLDIIKLLVVSVCGTVGLNHRFKPYKINSWGITTNDTR